LKYLKLDTYVACFICVFFVWWLNLLPFCTWRFYDLFLSELWYQEHPLLLPSKNILISHWDVCVDRDKNAGFFSFITLKPFGHACNLLYVDAATRCQ